VDGKWNSDLQKTINNVPRLGEFNQTRKIQKKIAVSENSVM